MTIPIPGFRRSLRVALLGMIVLGVPACGDSSRLRVYPVQLTLLHGKAPAVGAEVVFHPRSGEAKERKLFPNGRVGKTACPPSTVTTTMRDCPIRGVFHKSLG